jgi:hypothetical protein
MSDESTPIAGMRTRTGVDRARWGNGPMVPAVDGVCGAAGDASRDVDGVVDTAGESQPAVGD